MATIFTKNWHIFALAGILILAAFFRIWQIGSIPPGLHPDEAVNGLDAINTIETGKFRVFYPDNNGREGFYIWLLAVMFKVFGAGILQFRIVSAAIGTLTVAVIYFLAMELFSERKKARIIALSSSFFVATSFWHINFSRIGFRAILVPLFLTLSLYFLVRALKNGKLYNYAAAGTILGLGLYTYSAFRMAIIIPIAVFIFEFLRYCLNKKPKVLGWNNIKKIYINDWWWKLGILKITFVIVIIPLVFYFIQHPENFSSRVNDVFIFSKENPIKEFLASSGKTLAMFNFRGDMNWRHNFAGSPQLFLPVGILFLAGFLLSFKKLLASLWNSVKKQKQIPAGHASYFMLHTSFIIMLLPAALTWEGIPHALRSIGVIPIAYIFSGMGFFAMLTATYGFFKKRKASRTLSSLLVTVFFLAAAFFPYNHYLAWGAKPEVQSAFAKKLVDIGNYIIGGCAECHKDSDSAIYVIDENGPWKAGNSIAVRTIRFIVYGKKDVEYIFFDDLENLNLKTGGNVLIIPMKNEERVYETLLEIYGDRLKSTMFNRFTVLEIESETR